MSELKTKIEAARAALTKALTAGDPTARLREYVRELEAEAQRLANEEAAAEAAKRAAEQSAAAEHEAAIRVASQTLQEARNARLNAVRVHLTVRTIPDTRSSLI
ncbi:hypothetical protein LMG28727_00846 [Paraburkholderia kirstenboschensis]|uniref:hypothetical protein n=1 Tax=Paraburkholderia kirstenboschensis TaxID=1245436 RepID=UPI000AD5C57D|nr:hypothetical protein [Paraburkholderia kirstenboschensis]CAD6514127.1 hypothetical protein LMG28727_00846 [Paraburkholderia kirstenboschensis]